MLVINRFFASKSCKNIVIYKSTSQYANYDENNYVMIVIIIFIDGTDTKFSHLMTIVFVCACVRACVFIHCSGYLYLNTQVSTGQVERLAYTTTILYHVKSM